MALMGHADQHPGNDEAVKRDWMLKRGIEWRRDQYACVGVIIMNLKWFRENGIEEKMAAFMRDNPDAPWPDQHALYAMCVGKTKFFSDQWGTIDNHLHKPGCAKPVCMHYVQWKPWKASKVNRFVYLESSLQWVACAKILLGDMFKYSDVQIPAWQSKCNRLLHLAFICIAYLMLPLKNGRARLAAYKKPWLPRPMVSWISARRLLSAPNLKNR